MRQLYGRRGRGNGPINITNYSVEEEYNNNEVSRSMGLLEEVKPVRSIAPGKHQLSSLLNGKPFTCLNYKILPIVPINECSLVYSCAIAKGRVGGCFCPREKEQKRGWLQIWVVRGVV